MSRHSRIPRPPACEAARPEDLPVGGEIEGLVLSSKESGARVRLLSNGRGLVARVFDAEALIPGEIATLRIEKTWTFGVQPFVAAEVVSACLDLDRLDIAPLLVVNRGLWDPEADPLIPEGEPIPEWLRPIVARGTRPELEMEQVLPGYAPDEPDDDPILRACDLANSGLALAGRDLLMDVLAADLRCIDAHAHLGNFAFVRRPEVALRYYRVGVALGDRALGPGFSGLVPWPFVDNRPFLRSLHGYGLALWRVGRQAQAKRVFERLLWLNPTDHQGARGLLDDLKAGRSWEDVFEESSDEEDGTIDD